MFNLGSISSPSGPYQGMSLREDPCLDIGGPGNIWIWKYLKIWKYLAIHPGYSHLWLTWCISPQSDPVPGQSWNLKFHSEIRKTFLGKSQSVISIIYISLLQLDVYPAFSLVESFMHWKVLLEAPLVMLRQLSYAIKNQWGSSKIPLVGGILRSKAGSLWYKTAGVVSLRAPLIGPFSAWKY